MIPENYQIGVSTANEILCDLQEAELNEDYCEEIKQSIRERIYHWECVKVEMIRRNIK